MQYLWPLLLVLTGMPAFADDAATAAPSDAAAPDTPAPDTARVNILRAMLAARDTPFVEPKGDLKALLLKQNPALAAPDCGVRYKQLDVADSPGTLTLLVAPAGRCQDAPGMPPQWVLRLETSAKR